MNSDSGIQEANRTAWRAQRREKNPKSSVISINNVWKKFGSTRTPLTADCLNQMNSWGRRIWVGGATKNPGDGEGFRPTTTLLCSVWAKGRKNHVKGGFRKHTCRTPRLWATLQPFHGTFTRKTQKKGLKFWVWAAAQLHVGWWAQFLANYWLLLHLPSERTCLMQRGAE